MLIDNCEVSVLTTIEVSEKMGVFGSAGAGWLNIELGRLVIEFNPRSINFLLPLLFSLLCIFLKIPDFFLRFFSDDRFLSLFESMVFFLILNLVFAGRFFI